MRLTDQQIRATVARMDRPEASKRAILRAALAGDGPSRFVVYREFKRQNGIVEQNAATGLYAQWLARALVVEG